MNFVNNYAEQVALPVGVTSLELDLFNGHYRLTISDGRGAQATRYEHLDVVMQGGIATLQRGQEGSDEQDWPDGSWIYCSVTAGVLTGLQQQIAELAYRVTALEQANIERREFIVGVQRFTFGPDAYETGYSAAGLSRYYPWLGSISPETIDLPSHGTLGVFGMFVWRMDASTAYFLLSIESDLGGAGGMASIDVEGVGQFDFSAATRSVALADGLGEYSQFSWLIEAEDWSDGVQRTVTITLD